MHTQDLVNLIESFSGGTDQRFRHWANRRFIYSLGVKEVADRAGGHWLLDIIATEVAPIMMASWLRAQTPMGFLQVKVKNGKADLIFGDDVPENLVHWSRHIMFTDFPEGDWVFYIAIDGLIDPAGEVVVMFLPSEN